MIGIGLIVLFYFVIKFYVFKMDFNLKEMMFVVEMLFLFVLWKRVEFFVDDIFVYLDDRVFFIFEVYGWKYFIYKEFVEV